MNLRPPINIKLLDPKTYIQKNNCLPVTSHQIYEPSTMTFHPEGLFSEIIFGQVGSTTRLYQRGYIDLRTKIFQPHIYKTIVSLKALYGEVLSGKTYAKYDKDIHELVRADMMEPGAGTGYSFFLKWFPKIEFKSTESLKRKDKLSILDKYRNILLIDKYLVIAAGIRDVRVDDGSMSSEEINKYYMGLMSLTQAMPELSDDDVLEDNAIFDSLRFNIQMRVLQIYEYIENLVTGKKGFAQGKFAARNVALGSRNVITSPPLSRVKSPQDPKYMHSKDTLLPLYQVAKGATPLMIHGLKDMFFNQIFDNTSINYSLIDSKTLELKYFTIKDEDRVRYTTSDGIKKLIDLFRNENMRHYPVAIKDESGKFQYLYLVYDLGDKVYLLRNKDDFAEALENKVSWGIQDIKHLELFDKYEIDKTEAVISGSAALMAHGYPDGNNEDLDVTISKATFDRLAKEHGFKPKPNNKKDTPVLIDPTGNMEVMYFSPVSQTEHSKVKASADEIDGYLFDSLFTLQMGYSLSPELRPKDKPKLRWLKNKVYDPKYLRPLTYAEMFYIVAYVVINLSNPPKHTTATRYPILNVFGIIPTNINIQTTEPNRTVELVHPVSSINITLPRYPIYNGQFQDSMSPHPSILGSQGGDFDGDVMSAIVLLSDDANKEISNFQEQNFSMVNSIGKLNNGLSDCKIGGYTFYTLSREPKEKRYI